MTPQSLTRTSAVIYADNVSSRKTETIKKKFVEAVLTTNENKPMSKDEIGAYLLTEMDLTFTDPELDGILSDQEIFVLQQFDGNKAHDKYYLTAQRFAHLSAKASENIDECIKQYFLERGVEETNTVPLRELLENYLYVMMNTNIEAYKQVLGGSINKGGENKNGRVRPEEFTEQQIQEINSFLSWKNPSKDKELYKLVSCCIEYAIVANNSNEKSLHQSLQNKILYIDNALIYRAIGINGEDRKKRTQSFIKKCNECGQQLKISKFTREEFHRTIDFNINQLSSSAPFGRINSKLFSRYCYGDTIYQFYHNWRSHRYGYAFNSFKTFVVGEYNSLVRTYNITEDFRPPFDEREDIPEVERYSNEIELLKKRGHKDSHDTDARNMYWIEKARGGVDARLMDTKYYFITPDQKLQLWDSGHSVNQPIALLPSQWLALLLKYTSRSSDDYKSFVSFLRLSHNETELKPEDLQEILAGISEVTEDMQKQSDYLEVYMEEEWRHMEKGEKPVSLREDARRYTKDKQEQEFKEELEKKSQEMAAALAREKALNQEQIAAVEKTYKKQQEEQERSYQKDRLEMRVNFTKQALATIQRQLLDVTARKNQADEEINKKVKSAKCLSIIALLFIVAVWIGLIFYFTWDKMEVWTYIVGALFFLSSICYMIFYEKEFSLKKTIETYKSKKKDQVYTKYNVSDTTIDDYNQEITVLEAELAGYEAELLDQ